VRQRLGNGNAVFVAIEDKPGTLNLIVWKGLAECQRRVLLQAKLLGAWSEIQRAEGVRHLICKRLLDHTGLLGELSVSSRDFH
jgi:error-prone DNA polymerase